MCLISTLACLFGHNSYKKNSTLHVPTFLSLFCQKSYTDIIGYCLEPWGEVLNHKSITLWGPPVTASSLPKPATLFGHIPMDYEGLEKYCYCWDCQVYHDIFHKSRTELENVCGGASRWISRGPQILTILRDLSLWMIWSRHPSAIYLNQLVFLILLL